MLMLLESQILRDLKQQDVDKKKILKIKNWIKYKIAKK